ncbi:MAG: hypothetical protein C0503_07655 [Gemmatimonas sp.]|nr:hypothetical protein [Gemmatimonas sp.]
MPVALARHRSRPLGFITVLAAVVFAAAPLGAQATRATAPAAAANATSVGLRSVDLQGIWDFTMRVGERTSPGFIALGPLDGGWAGSITMYVTNTLAIRRFTIEGDSLQMVVASREGDVTFRARLSANADTLQGIVDYHGGARLPMVALRRPQPAAPR